MRALQAALTRRLRDQAAAAHYRFQAHLERCSSCRRAQRAGGLYCDVGRELYRAQRAAKKLATAR